MPLETARKERQAAYAPTDAARLNYLSYLLLEPQMEDIVGALAALDERQRRAILQFLRTISPGDRLATDREGALIRGSRA